MALSSATELGIMGLVTLWINDLNIGRPNVTLVTAGSAQQLYTGQGNDRAGNKYNFLYMQL